MAANSIRYKLRSSQRAVDNSPDYETPRMDDSLGDVYNVQLSQGDIFLGSQVGDFLSDSFGSKFNNMNSLTESELRDNLSNIPEEENDRPPSHYQYEDQEFAPIDEYQPALQYMDDDSAGCFVYSQGISENKFTVVVMPQGKSANLDYIVSNDLLFVKYMAAIPFTFVLLNSTTKQGVAMDSDMKIRMSLRFTRPVSDDKLIVARCDMHAKKDTDGAHNNFAFKVSHRGALYDPSNLSVSIPASTVVSITFYCYSSCAGGIDRNPVHLYFELLNSDGSVWQSASFNVKVSANPTRDAPKEEERRRKEEEKRTRSKLKSEASGEGRITGENKGRKRKSEDTNDMGREMKRMESISPMMSIHTPSPGWNTTMAAPRASTTSRRPARLDLGSTSSDGMAMESNGSRKTSIDDDENSTFTINIHGRKKYEAVIQHLALLEKNERYSSRHDEFNPFENLTQLTGDVSISTWLAQYNLDDVNYVAAFRNLGVGMLDDVSVVYNPSLFHFNIGIPQPEAANLNKIYLNWLNGNACNQN